MRVCSKVAHALSACVKRTNDVLARYGGEEFAAILPSTNLQDAILVAERMRAAVEAMHIDHDGSTLGRVSISVGVASVDAHAGVDPMSVVKLADEAAYQAKEGGRNRVVAPPDYESGSLPALRRQAARHNLPLQLTRFLGRERELAEVRKLLGDLRLVRSPVRAASGRRDSRSKPRAGASARSATACGWSIWRGSKIRRSCRRRWPRRWNSTPQNKRRRWTSSSRRCARSTRY